MVMKRCAWLEPQQGLLGSWDHHRMSALMTSLLQHEYYASAERKSIASLRSLSPQVKAEVVAAEALVYLVDAVKLEVCGAACRQAHRQAPCYVGLRRPAQMSTRICWACRLTLK
jgi:hypothetical protein